MLIKSIIRRCMEKDKIRQVAVRGNNVKREVCTVA